MSRAAAKRRVLQHPAFALLNIASGPMRQGVSPGRSCRIRRGGLCLGQVTRQRQVLRRVDVHQ
ncbi:MAG: hypothetical protein MEP44_10380, partial [Blastomonas sp.]|nr:hypothetical protein [Blastomonas sp.]